MLVLDTTSAIIRYKHTAALAGTTAGLSAWADSATGTISEGKTAVTGSASAGTYATVAAAPAASTSRDVVDVWIQNPVTNIADVFTVEFYDGSTAFIICAITLNPGDTLHIGDTIDVVDATGNTKHNMSLSGLQNRIFATPNGSTGAAALRAMVAADMPNAGVATTDLTGTWPALSVGAGKITSAKTDTTNDGGTLHQAENLLHNGRFNISQRATSGVGSIDLVNNTLMYGNLDRWKVKVAATSASGCRFSQASSPFTNDFSFVSGRASITTTGSGSFTIRQYVEGTNAVKLLNRNGVFSARVYQDSGGALNYTMNIYPMTLRDNGVDGTALTGGNLGATQSVANTTETLISSGAIAMGANMGNGCIVEIIITFPSAITNKNFYFTQMQLQLGSTVTPCECEDIQIELAKCQRYCFTATGSAGNTPIAGATVGASNTTTSALINFTFPVRMRRVPTFSLSAGVTIGHINLSSMTVAGAVTTNPPTNGLTSFGTDGAFLIFTASSAPFAAANVPAIAYWNASATNQDVLIWDADF